MTPATVAFAWAFTPMDGNPRAQFAVVHRDAEGRKTELAARNVKPADIPSQPVSAAADGMLSHMGYRRLEPWFRTPAGWAAHCTSRRKAGR